MRRNLVLLVVLGATLAACGGGGSRGDVITASAIARDTAAAGTARIAMTSTPSAGEVLSTANGVTDFRHDAGEFTTILEGSTGTWTLRWVGGHVYMRATLAPGLAEPVPTFFASGTWYRMDDTSDNQAVARAFTHVFRPDFLLDAMRSSSRAVRTLGSDTIRGVATTHLQLVVDTAAMERKLAAGATVTTEEGQHEPPTQVVDVWVDARHRLRRLSAVDAKSDSDTPTETVTSIDFYDYGVPVDVQPPPANEVAELPSFEQDATSSATAPASP